MMMIKVRLLLFAVLRDIVGKSSIDLDLAEGSRPLDVWEELRRQHRALDAYEVPPLTAINETYAQADTVLRAGDELAFIPPVAGG